MGVADWCGYWVRAGTLTSAPKSPIDAPDLPAAIHMVPKCALRRYPIREFLVDKCAEISYQLTNGAINNISGKSAVVYSGTFLKVVMICFTIIYAIGLTPARAEMSRCDDVISFAEVHHDPIRSVTYTSRRDRGDKFCRFSIDGYTEDADVRERYGTEIKEALNIHREMIQDQQIKVDNLTMLPFLWLASSPAYNDSIELAIKLVGENADRLSQCYNAFFSGEASNFAVEWKNEAALFCETMGSRFLETKLIIGPFVTVATLMR